MRPPHLALALGVFFAWGLNMIAVPVFVTHVPPLFGSALRFAVLALLVLPFVPRPVGKWRPVLLLAAALGTGHFGLLFIAFSQTANFAPLAVALQLYVPFSAILAWSIDKDRMGPWRLLGASLAFGGVVVMGTGPGILEAPLGLILTIAAAFMFSVAALITKRTHGVGALSVYGWMGLFAVPQLLALSWMLEDGQIAAVLTAPWDIWVSFAYIVLAASLFGHVSWTWLLQTYPVSTIVPLSPLAPLFGALASVWWFGEAVEWQLVLGGAATFAGVGVVLWRQARQAPETICETLPASGAAVVVLPGRDAPLMDRP